MSDSPEIPYRLALYARVSSEEQREGQTIDSQISELDRYAREKGWPIVGTYKDDGWSGGVMERPELDRLRDDAPKGVFDAVLINDVDRLARDVAHLGVIKRDLEKKNVRVIFRKLPSDASPTYNLMVNILGSFAEFERELILDRTRRGRRHKVETKKLYLGSNTAYGYRYTPKDRLTGNEGCLAVEHREATVVRQMFAWVDQDGLSARRVMVRLNEQRIVPRRGAARWAKSSVLRILHCETYAGIWHYNKHMSCEPLKPTGSSHYRRRRKCSIRLRSREEWIPLELPESLRIVSRDQWERVQQQLRRNVAFSPRNEKHSYIFKGLIRCGSCQARYVGEPDHGRFGYRCLRRCKQLPSISEHRLFEIVKAEVSKAMLNPSVLLEPLREIEKGEEQERQRLAQDVESAKPELERLAIEEERILEAYRSAILSPAQLAAQLEKIKARRTVLEQQLACASLDKKQSDDSRQSVSDYCTEAAQNLANFTPEDWCAFLRLLIEEIIFQGDHIVIRGRIPGPRGVSETPFQLPDVIVP